MGHTLSSLRFLLFRALPDHLFATLPTPNPSTQLSNCTYLITGSNTGIGYAAAVHLARLAPARIVLAVRDLPKGEAAKTRLVEETGFTGRVDVWELDMSDFTSVVRFAARVKDGV
ncbi:hypothetical protein R3P38DRAFT_2892233 [Favolaschia claudopus]|uniref:Uncharacterized protein n=1 Tax=Favolaschia claudopus TaxID=2862362 RepID=A0AAW0CWD3_9AGAR